MIGICGWPNGKKVVQFAYAIVHVNNVPMVHSKTVIFHSNLCCSVLSINLHNRKLEQFFTYP